MKWIEKLYVDQTFDWKYEFFYASVICGSSILFSVHFWVFCICHHIGIPFAVKGEFDSSKNTLCLCTGKDAINRRSTRTWCLKKTLFCLCNQHCRIDFLFLSSLTRKKQTKFNQLWDFRKIIAFKLSAICSCQFSLDGIRLAPKWPTRNLSSIHDPYNDERLNTDTDVRLIIVWSGQSLGQRYGVFTFSFFLSPSPSFRRSQCDANKSCDLLIMLQRRRCDFYT